MTETKPPGYVFIEGGWRVVEEIPHLLGGLWQPISEMPEAYKDGRELIVWERDGTWLKVTYESVDRWGNHGLHHDCWTCVDDTHPGGGMIALEDVTHWMPTLPAPPRNKDAV